ncbi:hypothetical protein D9M68_907270 [compost metagenome]
MVGVDRVADRFEAEEVLPGRAIDQVIASAAGTAVELVTGIFLDDSALAVPAGKGVIDLFCRQQSRPLEIPGLG